MITTDQLQTLPTGAVRSTDGEKIGSIGEIYLDDVTGQPAWVTVNTGLFGTATSFVPLDGASIDGDDIVVPFTKDKVKDAPRVDVDQHLEVEQEHELYAYYGQDYQSGFSGRTESSDIERETVASDRTTDAESMTLHAERLNVGKERVETGTARLRKYVVGEEQTVNVPLEQETVSVERRQLDGQVVDNGRIGEGDEVIEVTTSEERPVVSKDTVATEEVGLRKDVTTRNAQVSETVSHEEVELEGDSTGRLADDRSTLEKAKDALDGDSNRDGKLLS